MTVKPYLIETVEGEYVADMVGTAAQAAVRAGKAATAYGQAVIVHGPCTDHVHLSWAPEFQVAPGGEIRSW